jgi:type VI secretion system secreted protein VgrG
MSPESEAASGRFATVSSWLPDGVLLLERGSFHEELGKPFEFQVDLLSTDPGLDLREALGKRMVVEVDLNSGATRYFNGLVTRFSFGETRGQYHQYRATLRPWIWLLSRTSNCRIFQNMTVPEIVKAVFRSHGFGDFDDKLAEAYRSWDYLVQYRETDLNFVNRILEQEGIYYFFEHGAEKHTLLLADSLSSHAPTPGYEVVPFLEPEVVASMPSDLEYIDGWNAWRQLQAGAFSATDFNFETPKASLLNTLKGSEDDGNQAFEIFDYPGEFKNADEGETSVKLGLQEQAADVERLEGTGNSHAPMAGGLFTLSDYPRDDQNKQYLVVSASCSVTVTLYVSGTGAAGGTDFHCSFVAMDSQRQFRCPRRTPKPVVQGPQTAIVVGPSGEEIWTDQYGRVKVQFHWDREGKDDENSSCWVRVAQVWAGAKWGSMHIPRIGQEVIVDFLEGDPDRPIITGRVYNADNMPPYDLPANQTQSGIKSRSTKGGAPSNFNEIRFEDKKGSEEMFLQAEKNQTTNVKHNRGATVGGGDSISVGGDRSVSVSGNLSVTVQGGGKGAVHSMLSVTGKHGLHASDTIEIDAPTHIKLTCGGSSLLIEPGKITLASGGRAIVVLDANVLAQSSAGSKVVLDANALAKSSGGSQVLLDANVLAKSSGGATVALDSNAAVDGAKATVTGKSETVVSGGAGTMKADGGGVAISGPMVKVNG